MADITRSFGRSFNEMRPINFEVGINRYAEGSCLVSYGYTKVHCTASVENSVPGFLKNQGKGWVTAEYAMLPRSTNTRNRRERDKSAGRSIEIQRLIGRSLRGIVDHKALGEMTIYLDCDVMQADGGTRTASISGAYVAMAIAIKKLQASGMISSDPDPLLESVAAVSVGIYKGQHLCDLDYNEDSNCEVDMNVVMTGSGKFIEVQGTAEDKPFSREAHDNMLKVAEEGINQITELQKSAIERGVRFLNQ